ncbi:hypothetical protein F5890DRAFT_814189 [Lentinula detonsa]|uniref:Uncharacterized protein n=1 Tax=Lentinula detonsa TaxID=2804962 RepID=A0AA38Q4K6_9AGAR|nr:hypothetical protein F5890DRAFT_814189 [Lentinula detonsa]
MKTKRCHFYDSRGRPRMQRNGKPSYASNRNGCRCHNVFAHPEDPEWALLSAIPAPKYLARTPSPSPPPPPTKPRTSVLQNQPMVKADTTDNDFDKALLTLIELKSNYEVLSVQHRKLQQILDDTALLPSPLGHHLSTEQLVSRRNTVENQLKDAYARIQDWEMKSSSKQNLEITIEPEISTLRNLLQEFKVKLAEAESLKKEVEATIKKRASTVQAQMDTDGDILMMDAAAPLNQKQSSPHIHAPSLNIKHLDLLQSMLSRISEQVSSVESNVATQEQALKDIIQTSSYGQNVSSVVVDEINQEVDYINDELSELAAMTAEIVAEDDKLDLEYQRLLKDREDQEAELQKLMGQVEELQKEREKDEGDLATLSSSLATYLGRPMSPSSSPYIPEDIEANLEEEITLLVRSAIKPHIEALRSDLAQEMMEHEAEVTSTLSPIFMTTSQAIGSISNATIEN